MSNSDYSDIEFGIKSDAERYSWIAYNIFGVLSSLVGDILILLASSQKGSFRINRILVTIIQHVAVSDLAHTTKTLLPIIISLLGNSWILGTTLCYATVYMVSITYPAGMSLIAFLTTAKFLILDCPLRAATWNNKWVHQVCCFIWLASFTAPMPYFVLDNYDVAFDFRVYTCIVCMAINLATGPR